MNDNNNIGILLQPDRVMICHDIRSKKRLLEKISEILAGAEPGLTEMDVRDCLLKRERLGSTGLGHGVAMPHGRIAGIDRSLACFVKLTPPVDYDAADGEPVDLVMAILMPESCSDTDLRLLPQLSKQLGDRNLCERLRRIQREELLFNALQPSRPQAIVNE